MNIEPETRQNQPDSELQKAITNIISTHNALVNEMNDFFKGFDITRQQYNVLKILQQAYPNSLPIHKIREQLIDKMSDASRIVERLRVKDLVQRTISEQDKRSVQVIITEKGIKKVEAIETDIDRLDQTIQNLSPEEIILLNGLLDKIKSNSKVLENSEA